MCLGVVVIKAKIQKTKEDIQLNEEQIFIDKLSALLKKKRSVDIGYYKSKYLLRRINVRRRALGNISLEEYIERISNDSSEITNLLDTLTVNVSDFFRDPRFYDTFRNKILPEVLKSERENIRIWSAGCATGQEPYTIAMLMKNLMQNQGEKISFRIWATDIDRQAIKQARKGEYSEKQTQSVSKENLDKYFSISSNQNTYTIKDCLKRKINFFVDDILKPFDEANFDIISCKNVLIYFNSKLQKQAISNFSSKLNLQGYLALGPVERLMGKHQSDFEKVDSETPIYRKIKGAKR